MNRPSALAISGAVEGLLDEAVLRRLAAEVGAQVATIYGRQGKSHLRERLAGYNAAARLGPWVVLMDLDQDAECAPPLRSNWLPDPAPDMCFRVAVHEVEAWLLADRVAISALLGIPAARIPVNPDAEVNPKETMIRLARMSRHRGIVEDMVPRPGSGRAVGDAYTSRLVEFVQKRWRPRLAADCSDSLCRCLRRLEELAERAGA